MFTAIYVRQSVERPDSVSLETQEALCRQDAAGEADIRVYADRGYSGKNMERPALRSLLDDISAGKIARVLVYKLDRISRNLADFTQLLRHFQAHGVEFLSHSERFETASPMGQAMQSLLMVFAQLERETISGRVRDAAFSRAKQGFDTGGVPPVGFRKVSASLFGKQTSILIPDKRAAEIANGFSAYLAADCTLTRLAAAWNADGIRTARGGGWSAGTLARVLRNPVYAQADSSVYAYLSARGAEICVPEMLPAGHGIYLYTDRRRNHSRFTDLHGAYAICAPHEGIVAPEIWLGCQEKLDVSRRNRTLGQGSRSFLSGVIFCMRCGSAMTVVRGRSMDYLVCGGKKRGKCGGAGAVWRVAEAETLAEVLILRRLQMIRENGAENPAQTENSRRQALDALLLRREKLIRILTEDDSADFTGIAEALRRIEAKITALRETPAVKKTAEIPDWTACDRAGRQSIAKHLLLGIFADGDTLHCFFR